MDPLLPPGWPRPRGYSNGLRVPAGRDLVFIAGMVGWDESERLVPGGFVPQFRRALENVIRVLAEAGGSPADLVRLTVFVTDLSAYRENLAAVGEAWRAVMGAHYPAMSLVRIAGLLEDGALVEVEATAAVSPRGRQARTT